nr:Ig-like domain repeat protein [Microlunatus antarcticus]
MIRTTSALTFDQETPVYGQPVTATVTVTGTTAGFVQLSVDGKPFGDRVSVLEGTASIDLPTDLGAGGHPVKAVFTPLDETYAESSVEQSLPVAQAKTSTDLTVRANQASVVVAAVAPGAGTPEGTVVFSFGDTVSDPVTLVRGKAAYDGTIPADTFVSVVYSGDDDFAGSSTSTLRKSPTIKATVSSDAVKSPTGWYRASVTVSFDCVEGSAPLTDDCPDPVTLSADAASQGVSKTIIAEDGGVATASVTGINIDTTKPVVDALGVEDGDRFFSSAPEAGCRATDALSGVSACAAQRKVDGKAVTYSVIAVDQAGNTTTRTVRASTYVRGIVDAPYVDGAYTVKAGQAVTLVAKSSKRPQVYKPVEAPKTPSKSGDKFKATENDDEWALGYTIPTSLKPGKTYNLGIKTTSKYTIKLKVIS